MQKNSNFCNPFSAEERGGQCVAGDLAYLQTHEAVQENHPLEGEDPPAEVPSGNLRVSQIFYPDPRRIRRRENSALEMNQISFPQPQPTLAKTAELLNFEKLNLKLQFCPKGSASLLLMPDLS